MSTFQFQEAEFYAAAIVGTASRFQNADFSSPWMSSPFSILIPIPKSATNVRALIEPMSTEVNKNLSIDNFYPRKFFKLTLIIHNCYCYQIVSGVDLHRFIHSDCHAKSFWFKQMYCFPEQKNEIETVQKEC